MAGLHPVGMEAVAIVETDRKRVVAQLPIQRSVDASRDAASQPFATR